MRAFTTLAALAALTMPVAAFAQAAPAAPAATAAPTHYTTADTTISVLLGDPAAKAVLMKIIPEIAGSEQIAQAGGLTLKAIQQYAPDRLPDAKLSEIDYELAKLPAK